MKYLVKNIWVTKKGLGLFAKQILAFGNWRPLNMKYKTYSIARRKDIAS